MKKYDHHLSSGVEIFVAPWVGRGKALELMPEHQYVLLSFKDDHYLSLFFLPMSISLSHTHTTHSISYNDLYFVFSTQRCFTSCLASLMYSFLYSIKGIFETNFCEILSLDFTFSMKTIYILFCS